MKYDHLQVCADLSAAVPQQTQKDTILFHMCLLQLLCPEHFLQTEQCGSPVKTEISGLEIKTRGVYGLHLIFSIGTPNI